MSKPEASAVIRLWLRLHENLVGMAIVVAVVCLLVALALAYTAPNIGRVGQPIGAVVTGVVPGKTKSQVSIRTADGGLAVVTVLNIQFCRIGSSIVVLKYKSRFGYTYAPAIDTACK